MLTPLDFDIVYELKSGLLKNERNLVGSKANIYTSISVKYIASEDSKPSQGGNRLAVI
jgi:hypothetical protein